MPEEFIAIATTRIAAINAAYEMIERGLQAGMSGFPPDHAGAEVRVSPNFGPRRDALRPDIIILHYTGMETGAGAEAWLCDPASEVSSHYLVHEDGRIVQMVRESDRAWHAGQELLARRDRHQLLLDRHRDRQSRAMRSATATFRGRQIDAVIALCRGIAARHRSCRERVLAHSDVAPGRKIDPGEKFPWRKLAAAGVGHFVAPARVGRRPRARAPATAAQRSRGCSRCWRSTATASR